MKLGIMQPYFFPYLGYFQLIKATDAFVVYDDIQFTKSGWIHRNRMLVNEAPCYFTLPIKKDSDHLQVRERQLSDNFPEEANKLLRRFEGAYRNAPHFHDVYELLGECLSCRERNLFQFVFNSLQRTLEYLELPARLIISSTLQIDPALRNCNRVIATCKSTGAIDYINPPGGRSLYCGEDFRSQGIELWFLEPRIPAYPQFNNIFVENLSIIDVLMFNSKDTVRRSLAAHDVIRG